MAASGWGGAYSNPFAQQVGAAAGTAAVNAATEQAATSARTGAFGAWGGGLGSSGPAASQSSDYPTPALNGGAAAGGGGDLAAREAQLARREAELSRREAQLASATAQSGGVIKNWPSCCPFIYHNIREQIPAWNRSMVRFTYLVELVSIAAFFYNAIILLATLFAGIQRPGLQWWFLSLLTITLGVPLSWWLFYKSIFNSAQTDGKTYSYIRSFMLTLLHMAWCVWMILGIDNLGEFSAGIFPMFRMFQRGDAKGTAFGIMFIINIALWGIAAFGCWVVIGLAVAAYRRGDGPRRDYEERMGGVQMNAV